MKAAPAAQVIDDPDALTGRGLFLVPPLSAVRPEASSSVHSAPVASGYVVFGDLAAVPAGDAAEGGEQPGQLLGGRVVDQRMLSAWTFVKRPVAVSSAITAGHPGGRKKNT